jgi:hypothetical protein
MKSLWKTIVPLLLLLIAGVSFVVYKQSLLGSHTSIQKISDDSDGSLQSYLQQAEQLSTSNGKATSTATFLAVGDIMLSRNVALAMQNAENIDYPFLGMTDVLHGTNFNFANLESPFTDMGNLKQMDSHARGTPCVPGCPCDFKGGVIGGHSLIFGAPCLYAPGLKDYNFQIINLANNHAFDQGLEGLDYTTSMLSELNIQHEGTGDNLDQAWTPAVVTANGIKICFVGASYSSINDGGKATNNYVSRIQDVVRLKLAIQNAKVECDFVVATMHAGTEYTRNPNDEQTTFAHAAIDDGADIVIGAHPHWVQTVEKYNGKYIFYSLGNFIFDQNFSQDTMEGLTLKITVSKNTSLNPLAPGAATSDDLQGQRQPATLDSIELLPVIVQNSQPRPATEEEAKSILSKIGQIENILK